MEAPKPTSKQYISRRDLILLGFYGVLAGGAMATVATLSPMGKIVSTLLQKEEEFSGIAKDNPGMKVLEKEFGVALSPGGWSPEKLSLLSSYLELLPPHFYRPSAAGKICTFNLSFDSACCFVYNQYEIVPIDIDVLNSDDPRRGFIHVNHELVHRITPGYLDSTQDRIWDHEVLNILGTTSLRTVNLRLDKQINDVRENRKTPFWEHSKNYSLDEYFVDRLYYSLTPRPSYINDAENLEWIAVMGELYPRGRGFFVPQYSRFFDRKVANSLYEFTKSQMYHNREYTKYPIS